MIDKVIKLNNNLDCYVLSELDYEGKKYIFTAEVDKENENLTENYYVLEMKINSNNDLVVCEIEDFKVKSAVNNLFLAQMKNN